MTTLKATLGLGLVVAGGLLLGGCRHMVEHVADSRGSIKDDAISQPASTPARRVATGGVTPRTTTRVPVTKASATAAPRATAPDRPATAPSAAPPQMKSAAAIPSIPSPTAPAAPAIVQPAAPPAPPSGPNGVRTPPEAPDPAVTERHLEDGKRLFSEGKVLEARKRFVEALNGPIPEALLALARSFDTYYLSQLPRSDATPDMQRALTLYARANERGAADAAADLDRVRNILKQK